VRNSLIFSGGFHSLVFSLCSHFLPNSVVFLFISPFHVFQPNFTSCLLFSKNFLSFGLYFPHPPYSDAFWGSFCCPYLLFTSLLLLSRSTPLEAISYPPLPTHMPRTYCRDWVLSLMLACSFPGYLQHFIPPYERETSKTLRFPFEHQ